MRQIQYEYVTGGVPGGGSWGQIRAEKNMVTGEMVSQVTYPDAAQSPNTPGYYRRIESRGDGQTRVLQYGDSPQYPTPFTELTRYTDFQGHSTNISYSLLSGGAVRKSVTNARGYTTHTDRGEMGLITKITYPGGAHVDYTYSNTYYLHTSQNERAKVTTYTRDPTTHAITRIDYPSDANTPPSFEEFSYNPFGQVLTHHLRNGKYQHFQYDGRGLLTTKWNPTTNQTPVGGDPKTTYTYYTSGPWIDRVQTETLPANVSGYQASETYEYDKNPTGTAVPGRGLVTKITHADGKYQAFGYDDYGNKLWEENELHKRTNYTYDAYKRMLTAKNPLNKTTNYSYELTNGNQNLAATLHTTASVHLITTPVGIMTENRYDENFRKIQTKEAFGTGSVATTQFTYDQVGNLTEVLDPLSRRTVNVYDVRNRKISSTEASGTALATTATWSYDPASNVITIGRPDGTRQTKTYDALNRVLTDTVPQTATVNLTTRFVYNPSGTIQKVTDAKWQWTMFEYDPSDRKTRMTYHGGAQSQLWTYDAAGNLTSRTTVDGKTQSFTYDTRNRRITMTWSNSAEWAYFGYDDASRLIRALNGTGAWNTNIISDVVRAYDDAGHLTSDQQTVNGMPAAKNVTYPWYDDDGKLKRIYLAGGGYDYTFSYDAMGRFEKILTGGNLGFQYYYNAASIETQRHNYLSNPQLDQFYGRDSLNRMSARYARQTNGPTFSAEYYTYNRMSQVTEVARAEDGKRDQFGYYLDGGQYWAMYGVTAEMPEGEPDPDQDMTDTTDPWSDWAGDPEAEGVPPPEEEGEPTPPPLTAPDLPAARTVAYSYDRAGNRFGMNDDGTATWYTTNLLNQYTAVTGSTLSNGAEHEISSFQGNTYIYRNDERLVQVTSGGNTYYLAYDALGRCVKRTLNGVTTYYIYDGEKPLVEYNSSGAIVARNVYGKWIDEILMRTDTTVNGGQPFYYQQDRNQNVTHLTSAAGTVIEKYKYDAFGAVTIYAPNGTQRSTSLYKNRFLFTGREYAATFGFYEYRARAYNPVLGRFMSEDPKGFDAGDYNLFRYCHNDPLDLTDAMGLDAEFVLSRDMYPTGTNPRLAAGIMFVYENGRFIGAARVNANQFYPNRQGIPAGRYLVLPKAEDGNYKRGTPAITAPQFRNEPGRATEGHKQGDILIHPEGPRGQPDSKGCQTVSQQAYNGINAVFDRNKDSSRETVRNGATVPKGMEIRRALPAREIGSPDAGQGTTTSAQTGPQISDAAQIDNQQGEVPDFSMLGGGPLGLGGPPRNSNR
jgi:RHS repeat-associated protein